MSGIIQDLSFRDELISGSMMSSHSICVVAGVRMSFLFKTE